MVDILIVEDNPELAELLCDFLRAENYIISTAASGEKALEFFERYGAKLVILDIMLQGMDGFAFCARVREQCNTPILIVSAKTAKEDKLSGLIAGADDYIEKPFDIDILLAKIHGIFKRRYGREDLTDGNLRLDKVNRRAYKDGVLLSMTGKEFDLLLALMEHKGTPLSKEYLFNRVWGSDSFSEMQTLTVHIQWLRQKIEDDPKKPCRIVTVWGKGYRFL